MSCCNSNACSSCSSCGCSSSASTALSSTCGCNSSDSCGCSNWSGCGCWGCLPCCNGCPFPEWIHPILCNPAHFCCAGNENGPTLVIHKIVLEPCGDQSCTPRNFNIRITGPSYPNGEIFTLRAGSCLELDEPLVVSGLIPGQYTIEEIFSTPHEYVSTITGPVCGRCVMITNSCVPTVITIVNRKRLCRLCHGFGCGCSACSACCNS